MNDGRTGLIVLLLGAPEVLEGGEGREDRSTDPDAVFPLGRSNDLDLTWTISERAGKKLPNEVLPSCLPGRKK